MSATGTCDDGGVSAGKSSMQKSARDMILSLGLIGLVAGFVWLFIPHGGSAPDFKRVGYRGALLTARRAAGYPVAAAGGPPGTPAATSGRRRGGQGGP